MRKTFYTVTFAVLGGFSPDTIYFDSKESAYDFYNKHDYINKPVAHCVRNPEKIKSYEKLVNETHLYFNV